MKFFATLLFAVLALPAALAQGAKPTAASVKQLFEAMHSSSMVDSYMKQVETTMHTAVQQATAGKTPDARQKKIMELEKETSAQIKAAGDAPPGAPLPAPQPAPPPPETPRR
ncbi:MAG: hypothetical protein E6K38_04395 [Gammaproteobacteria bacterium]|nr:MAG: hypothetical protein E6K38_04395 [Gammaproteobacteria bacterium]